MAKPTLSGRIRRLTPSQRHEIEQHIVGLTLTDEDAAEPYVRAYPGWQCFHCAAVFKTVAGARLHFGPTPTSVAKCIAADAQPQSGGR